MIKQEHKKDNKKTGDKNNEVRTASSELFDLDLRVYQPACSIVRVLREVYEYFNEETMQVDWDSFEEKVEVVGIKISILLTYDPHLRIFNLFHYCCKGDLSHNEKTKYRSLLGHILYNLPNNFELESQEDKLVTFSLKHQTTVGRNQGELATKLINEHYNILQDIDDGKSSSAKHIKPFHTTRGYLKVNLRDMPGWNEILVNIHEDTKDELDTKHTDLEDSEHQDSSSGDQEFKIKVGAWTNAINIMKRCIKYSTLHEILYGSSKDCIDLRKIAGDDFRILSLIFHFCNVVQERDSSVYAPLFASLGTEINEIVGRDWDQNSSSGAVNVLYPSVQTCTALMQAITSHYHNSDQSQPLVIENLEEESDPKIDFDVDDQDSSSKKRKKENLKTPPQKVKRKKTKSSSKGSKAGSKSGTGNSSSSSSSSDSSNSNDSNNLNSDDSKSSNTSTSSLNLEPSESKSLEVLDIDPTVESKSEVLNIDPTVDSKSEVLDIDPSVESKSDHDSSKSADSPLILNSSGTNESKSIDVAYFEWVKKISLLDSKEDHDKFMETHGEELLKIENRKALQYLAKIGFK